MAGKLFNIYSGNTAGTAATSVTKLGSFGTSTDDFYSVNFDTGRKSIWTNNIEFGRAADWDNIAGKPAWIADGITWSDIPDKPRYATEDPTWEQIRSKPTATGDSTHPIYWNGSTFVQIDAVAPSSHDHDDRYLKLIGGTLSGDLGFSHSNSNTDAHIIWNSGTDHQRLTVRDGQTDVFIFQYSTDSGTTWNDYFTIQNGTAKIGTNTIYHTGNLPAYPTVYNAKLSLQANGTTKTEFYANEATNQVFNIAEGITNGTISVGGMVNGVSNAVDVKVHGLGSNAYSSTAYLPLAGGTMDDGAQIQRAAESGAWIAGRSNALIRETSSSGYHPLFSMKTKDGSWELGEYNAADWYNIPVFTYITDADFNNSNNSATYQLKFPLKSGTIAVTSDITWGNIADKPAYATRWPEWSEVTNKPAQVGSATEPVYWNGSTFVKIDAVAPSTHEHNRLQTAVINEADFDLAQWSGFYRVTKASSNSTLPGTPTDGNVAIHAAWDNGTNTAGLDILINDSTTSNLYYRARVGGNGIGDWKTLLDSTNYTDYTVKKDGTGATGTWAINISGNANTATKLKNTRQFTIGNSSKNFDGTGNVSWTLAEIGAADTTHNHDTVYVKLDAGTTEQTIKNSISSLSNGSIEIWRAVSGGYPMIGFASGTTKTAWGMLGFNAANTPIFRNTSGTDYKLWHEGNDGTGSGLDADKLDGFEATGLFQEFKNATISGNKVVYAKIGNTEKSFVVEYATSAGSADKLDNLDSTDFLRYVKHNTEWNAVANTPTDLVAGIHQIHVYNVEYSSILTGYDYNGAYWQLYFHPSSGYSEDIKYRATNCTTWKTILDSNNSSVSKSGETLSVKINGTTQSLTNTWRSITDTYKGASSYSSSVSLSQVGANNMYTELLNGYANQAGNADTVDNKHADDFLYRLRRANLNASSNYVGMIPPAILELKSAGYPLHTDPEFGSSNNNISVYNNSGGSDVTITRITDNQNSGNSTGNILKIHSSSGTASPYGGGFYFATGGTIGKIHVCIFRAKIPSGYNVEWHSNSIGDGASNGWLTSTDGTGKWEWYAYIVEWGSSPSSTFFFTLNKKENVDWYLSYANVIDITNGNYDGLRTRYSDYATSAGSASSVAWANITGKPTSKTAWGQTYIDSSGEPQSISGNMTSVGQVTPDGNATRSNGTASANWSAVYTRSVISGDHLTLTSGTSKDIIFKTNAGTEYMRLTSAGKLGIGTNNPKTTVHMKGDLLIDNDFSSNDHGIFFRSGFESSNKYNVSILAYDHNGSGESPDGLSINGYDGISFCTGSNTRNEVMRITSGGNVGIGTTSPDQKLHVTGLIKSVSNGKYLTIGCQNGSWAHYYTDATSGHYFDPGISVNGNIYIYNTTYGIRSNGNIYGSGFYHTGLSSNQNSYVLTAGGSYKKWNASYEADTIVARDVNGYINVKYIYSDIDDESIATIGSVYVRNNTDEYIRRVSLSHFASKLDAEDTVKIEKTLTVTEAWMDTGIVMNTDTFPKGTGTYVVQIYSNTAGSDGYYPYYSGIMTIYTSSTNGTGDDEVPLHMIGHATENSSFPNKRLYLKTVEQLSSNGKIQIAAASTLSSHTYTFKFRKLI